MTSSVADITEQRPCGFPIVYGYLRLASRSLARRTALMTALAGYCQEHELTLGAVFTEYGNGQMAMPTAFAGLLDVLKLRGVYGVVIPSNSHLGRGTVALHRHRHIHDSGVRLLIMRPRADRRAVLPRTRRAS